MHYRFTSVPIVTFAATFSIEESDLPEDFKGAKRFMIKPETRAEIANYLKSKIQEVCQDIDKVFASFDVDKSGTIDKNELRAVSAELGLNMSQTESLQMINDLDLNKDGLISPEEF